MIHMPLLLILLLSTLSLTGCENSRQALGLERSSPDEFAVLTRAPLEVPRTYALRPPRPGEARPQEISPINQARQALTRKPAAAAVVGISDAEQRLLGQAQALTIPPDIRQRVDEENAQLIAVDKNIIKALISKEERPLYPIVDPVAEVERLRQNKREGLPVNTGDVPQIEPDNSGLLP